MPNNILLSGPAGSGKSQLARDLLRQATGPMIAADFQSLTAAVLLQERGPDGKYPLRPAWVLPIVEYIRQTVLRAARERGLDLIATNSDGSPERRRVLLERLGPGSTEQIITTPEAVVRARLSDPISGVLSDDCEKAIRRWFGRAGR